MWILLGAYRLLASASAHAPGRPLAHARHHLLGPLKLPPCFDVKPAEIYFIITLGLILDVFWVQVCSQITFWLPLWPAQACCLELNFQTRIRVSFLAWKRVRNSSQGGCRQKKGWRQGRSQRRAGEASLPNFEITSVYIQISALIFCICLAFIGKH